MCGCLGFVLCCRKRLIKKRQKRLGKKILEEAGDVWIVNENAQLCSDSPGPGPLAQHSAAAAALQRPPDRAFILSNPQASQSSLLQYHDASDLTTSHPLPTLSPMTSYSGLMMSPMSHQTSTSQLVPPTDPQNTNPTAPPRHHIG